MKLIIQQGRVIDPESGFDAIADVYIDDQTIVGIGTAPDSWSGADQTLDATGQWLLPGVIDLAVTLRERKLLLDSETKAAIKSGITHICCMPSENNPLDTTASVNMLKGRITTASPIHTDIIGGLTQGLNGEQLTNMGGLQGYGCIGVSNARRPINNTRTLRSTMEYASTYGLTLFLHPIDHALQGEGVVHEGAIATRMGLPSIPVAAETSAMATIFSLLGDTGTKVHLCRLSSAKSVELLADARRQGLDVTADVAAHQLFLTDMDISDFNPLCHVQPPLRTEHDRDALRAGLANGVIDAICSDHQPQGIDAKLAPFAETKPGISGLETLIPLTMRLVEDKVLGLDQAIACLTQNPARILNNSQSGRLQVGKQANITCFDPQALYELKHATMQSQGKNTPFFGWSFQGAVSNTLIKGKPMLPDMNHHNDQ